MRNRIGVLLAAATAAAASEGHAQSPAVAAQPAPGAHAPANAARGKAAPRPKAAPKTVEAITVTGVSQDGMRTSIDRRSYGVANDLAATTGSIADALKNVPSVEVDVQGNVSLRGDPNVTILVDGKPSGLFRGASAAQALQSLPADSIERVEVITNPSAQFSPEGSAGIINLVTRKVRKPGRSGSVRLNLGTAGRRNGGVTGAYSADRLTLSGDAGFRHDPQHSVTLDDRSRFDATGAPLETVRQVVDNRGPLDQWNLRGAVDYDLNRRDRLSAELRSNQTDLDFHTLEHLRGLDPAGALNEVFDQSGRTRNLRGDTAGQLAWRRSFGVQDDLFVLASREKTIERNETEFTGVASAPVSPEIFQDITAHNALTLTQVKIDYNRPIAGEARLKAGYALRIDDNSYNDAGARGVGAAGAAPDGAQTNLFLYKQTINAAYVTYEQPFGDWTVLGGLRIEDVQLDLDQVTGAATHAAHSFTAYPSLHLGYRISEDQQLTASYSRRIQRPSPADLNPFRIEQDTVNFRAGNPNLQPEQTDSFEAGYQYRTGGSFYLATAYYRQSRHDVTDVVTDLGNGVLLDTKENLSSSRHAGLELVANGHLTKSLSYNASTNIYYAEIGSMGIPPLPGAPGMQGARSAVEGSGRFSLNWQLTPNDSFQASGQLRARRLTPQGHADPMFLSFLGYRHKFNDKLSAVVTVQDVLDTYRAHGFIDTPLLRDRVVNSGRIRAAYLGFSWSFGAPPKRPAEPPPEPEPEAIHGE
ncbi:MAG: TonB-dependent receptor domain-containing protein [Caulobacterales bacterium]